MNPLRLTGLPGTNPGAYLAALGALDVATRHLPERAVALCWDTDSQRTAVLHGPSSIDELIELCIHDIGTRWMTSPILEWAPEGEEPESLSFTDDQLAEWINAVLAVTTPADQTDLQLLCGLVTQGAHKASERNKKNPGTKPTGFDFTAGKVHFRGHLRGIRDRLADRAGTKENPPAADQFHEALIGPWTYSQPNPIGWDIRNERNKALLGATDDAAALKGNIGVDWLAFLGLRYHPVTARNDATHTTGIRTENSVTTFTWHLWETPLTSLITASVIARADLATAPEHHLAEQGIHTTLTSRIHTYSKGYQRFRPPTLHDNRASGPVAA